MKALLVTMAVVFVATPAYGQEVTSIDPSFRRGANAKPADAPESESRMSVHGSLLAGLGVSTDDLGAGSAFGLEAGVRYAVFPKLTFGLAARMTVERYTPSDLRAPCGMGPSPVLPGCAGTYRYGVDTQLYGIGVPITARFDAGEFSPYIGIAPTGIFERSETTITTSTSVLELSNNPRRFAMHGFVGLDWTFTGRSGAFLEVGYRRSSHAQRNGGEFTLGSIITQAGFRVVF